MQVDYIIVGAGSAGCIIAEQLTRCGRYSVLLLEAGGGLHNPWINIPAGFGATYYHPKYNYMYYSEPEPYLNNRQIYVPRGKGLGGSGSINAMVYVRGAARDFDDWAKAGNSDWCFSKILPYFKQLEEHPHGASKFRGNLGPIGITPMHQDAHPICQNFLQACQQSGYKLNADFNSETITGAGIYEANIRHGRRNSSYNAYLKPALKRSNLRLWKQAKVNKLTLIDSQVTGLEVTYKGFQHNLTAKEVILCAGAVGTPQLLELSGIGQRKIIEQMGITCKQELPAVGENLQDHLCASFYYRSKRKTLNDEFGRWQGKLKAGLQYALGRKGPLSISVNQAGGFFHGSEEEEHANIQMYFNPLSYEIPQSANAKLAPLPYSGYLVAVNPCRPSSRGSCHISSQNPLQAPHIKFNYLSTEHDRQEVIQAGNLVRKITQAKALKDITIREEKPAQTVQNNAQMLAYFQQHASSIYHLSGTCKMGLEKQTSVVNQQLQVHGLSGLRIADASIFPNITSGNINAPTMMVALKAADLLLQAAI